MAAGFIADTASLPLIVSNLVNIVSADFFQIGFGEYASVMAPVNIASVLASLAMLMLCFRRDIPATYDLTRLQRPADAIRDPVTFRAGWAVLGLPVREVLRQKGTPYDELGLSDLKWTDAQLLDFMLQHPLLINRPIVVTPLGTRLCRPSEAVLDILPGAQQGAFSKEDGQAVIDAKGQPVVQRGTARRSGAPALRRSGAPAAGGLAEDRPVLQSMHADRPQP